MADNNNKQTELDKLDIDELISETEEIVKKDKEEQADKKKEPEDEIKEEEKPKKKLPLKLISLILLIIIILTFTTLSVLEYLKKPMVKSGFFTINNKIIWLSKKKIAEVKIKSQIKVYKFNLKIAYKFNSINGIKILSATLFTKFTSKVSIPLDKLYEVTKENIYIKFKKIFLNKYIEDVKKYNTVISEIIKKTAIDTLKKSIPDINTKEVIKNLNFTQFLIS